MTDAAQKKAEAEKTLDENQKLSAKSEELTLKMMATKPTPTQRESDLAALGIVVEKEPSGAPKANPKTGAPLTDEEAKKLEEEEKKAAKK